MPGPLPVEDSRRRRRNQAPVFDVVKGGKTAVPTLGRGFSPAIRTWWRTVWTSPMASRWIGADELVVRRLAGVLDRIEKGDKRVSLLGEARQMEDRLGLTPLARARLRWDARDVVSGAEEADWHRRLDALGGDE